MHLGLRSHDGGGYCGVRAVERTAHADRPLALRPRRSRVSTPHRAHDGVHGGALRRGSVGERAGGAGKLQSPLLYPPIYFLRRDLSLPLSHQDPLAARAGHGTDNVLYGGGGGPYTQFFLL